MSSKRLIIIALFFLSFAYVQGQVNHVLNYSFEKETFCSSIGECSITTVNNWFCPSSPYVDWFSYPCFGASSELGVPQNFLGYQYARSGQCYAGIQPIGAGSQVGYITGTLSDSLKATLKYCVTFYVSLADSEWWATNSIGAYLSNDSICAGNNYNVLPYIPQIENPATYFITNKIDWVPVSGEFQAAGGESFITIGGFYNTTPSNTDSVGHGGFVSGENSEVQSYYYVDDVYVRELTIANAGKSDSICAGDSVMIGQDTTIAGVSFSWQPTIGLSNPNIAQPIASPTVTTTYTLTVTNDSVLAINNRGQVCNCADSVTRDSIVISVCTGINELHNSNYFNVFPNPNNGTFNFAYNLENESNSKLIIYDDIGIEVAEYLLSSLIGSMQISNPNLSQGLYIYKLYTSSGVKKVGKIVIIK